MIITFRLLSLTADPLAEQVSWVVVRYEPALTLFDDLVQQSPLNRRRKRVPTTNHREVAGLRESEAVI